MNIKDLMIGDWVIRRGVPEEPMCIYNMKVSANTLYLEQDGRGVIEKFENIEPIPLTSEILEKNNFERNGTDYLIQGFLYWSAFTGRLFIKEFPYKYNDITINITIDICECTYVHELQHILKICKIKKEIIL